MIWISTPRYTVGLIVLDGIVMEAPPIARVWALGVPARQVWDEAVRRGATVRWIP